MANLPWKQCGYPGCGELVQKTSRCPEHTTDARRQADKYRGSAASRGYDWKWQKFRKRYLAKHPICECRRCMGENIVRPADTIHHIVRLADRPDLKYAVSNLVAMARACHEVEEGRKR